VPLRRRRGAGRPLVVHRIRHGQAILAQSSGAHGERPRPSARHADAFADRFAAFVAAKGKVLPGVHRAFDYDPPRHLAADIRLAWRAVKLGVGQKLRGD
jgi:hypothetical protein